MQSIFTATLDSQKKSLRLLFDGLFHGYICVLIRQQFSEIIAWLSYRRRKNARSMLRSLLSTPSLNLAIDILPNWSELTISQCDKFDNNSLKFMDVCSSIMSPLLGVFQVVRTNLHIERELKNNLMSSTVIQFCGCFELPSFIQRTYGSAFRPTECYN